MPKIKLKVVQTKKTTSGWTAKLQQRTDVEKKDPVFGVIVTTNVDHYYVKTKAEIPVDSEIELDLADYEIEETKFRNSDENSIYHGDEMSAKWLNPKS